MFGRLDLNRKDSLRIYKLVQPLDVVDSRRLLTHIYISTFILNRQLVYYFIIDIHMVMA